MPAMVAGQQLTSKIDRSLFSLSLFSFVLFFFLFLFRTILFFALFSWGCAVLMGGGRTYYADKAKDWSDASYANPTNAAGTILAQD